MTVTKKGVFLAGLGAFLTLVAWPFGLHGAIFLFWNVLLFCLLALDFFLTPKGNNLKVRRDFDLTGADKLYFNADNKVSFYVKNHSAFDLKVQAKDADSPHFKVSLPYPTNIVPAGGEREFCYTTRPSKRGVFTFDNIYIRCFGILGLIIKYAKLPCPIDFKVYPNVRDLNKYRLMVEKNRLLPQGNKTVRVMGPGLEFESLRPYFEGDDYRKINWRATAREGKLVVNQYQIERNQPVYILLDAGRPMSYCVGGYKKLDYSINAALILCDIVNQQGDNAGLMVFDETVKSYISPGRGANHRNGIMDTLYTVADSRTTSHYEGAFRFLCQRQKRRSLVFIFTDFEILEEAEELIANIKWLKKRHMPIVVFMTNEGLNRLASKPALSKRDIVLKNTAIEFQDERKAIFKKLNLMGIPNIESPSEDFATAAVNRYIKRAYYSLF